MKDVITANSIVPSIEDNYTYQIGGSLDNYAPSYVVRQADLSLYESLKNGEFCYVLTSRQMGKSSLKIRVKHKLEKIGFHCVSLDLTRLGSENLTSEQWYKGIIFELWRSCGLISKINLKSWLQTVENLPSVQRLSRFFEEVILTEINENIVIFIDEIDSVLSLDFSTDDFFAFIRFCYNQRTENNIYNRLTFALFGVTTPTELINDPLRTPFNIGKKIELQGFKLNEINPLIKGLEGKIKNYKAVIKEILYWTNGQPFLTQKICKLVLENKALHHYINQAIIKEKVIVNQKKNHYLNQLFQDILINHSEIAVQISNLIKTHIIDNWQTQDHPMHLTTISNRLLFDKNKAENILKTYQKILINGSLPYGENEEITQLILSGLIIKKDNQLVIKNLIYQHIFNQQWVEDNLGKLTTKKCIKCHEICQFYFEDFLENLEYLPEQKLDHLIATIKEKYPEKI